MNLAAAFALVGLLFAPGNPAPTSEPSASDAEDADDASEAEATDAEQAEASAARERERAARARRADWAEGLKKGFSWKFKHGSSLSLGGLVTGQGILALDEVQGADATFRLAHARTQIRATFFDERLEAIIQPEFAGGARILDVEIAATFDQNFGLRAGFYRPRFMRDFRVNIPFIALPTRGAVHDHFSTGRRLGIAVEGNPLGGKLEYAAGIYNGSGGELFDERPPSALMMARFAVNPLGPTPYTQTPQHADLDGTRVSIGLNVASEGAPFNDDPPEGNRVIYGQQTTFAADATVMDPRGWLSVTGIRRWHRGPTGPVGSSGGYVMGGVPLGKTIFDLSGRSGVRARDGAVAQGVHEAAVNAYVVGNNLRMSVAYSCERERGFGPGCGRHSFIAQARLVF